MGKFSKIKYEKLSDGVGEVAHVVIDRPDVANALNAELIKELTSAFQDIALKDGVRVCLFSGAGKHFSAGADLNWMKDAAKMSYEENIADSNLLVELFESYVRLPMPTVAIPKGAVYGGAVGLIAASDIVIGMESSRFCLSEVKLGLLPAVIYPYLCRRLAMRSVKYYALTAEVMSCDTAYDLGLIDAVVREDEVTHKISDLINQLLIGGPEAQHQVKKLHAKITDGVFSIGDLTVSAIAEARTGKEGQSGLNAFFEKSTPGWVCSLPDNWTFES